LRVLIIVATMMATSFRHVNLYSVHVPKVQLATARWPVVGFAPLDALAGCDAGNSSELKNSSIPGKVRTVDQELPSPSGSPSYRHIDHIAIAVRDLESALVFFTEVLGFQLKRRLTVTGQTSGMVSAEIEHAGLKFVLCQGSGPQSQVCKLIEHYGPGVAHIALAVDDAAASMNLLAARGLAFDTTLIEGPGLRQVFSTRDPNSGLSFEFIERSADVGFLEENVQSLFEQLEKANAY
jgi:methylmalonyl-CoA/ethylmalonyl-CoA epimerase